MDWYNIFDLGEWDIYVRYKGIKESPTPDSRNYWVKATELDPAVGSVEVVGGEIICDFENLSGSGGVEISVVVAPVGWTPDTAPVRVSAYSVDGSGDREPFVGEGTESSAGVYADSWAGMAKTGEQSYQPGDGAVHDTLGFGELMVDYEFSENVPGGECLSATKLYGGF